MVTAINKKHQSIVKRFVDWNAKYDALVDLDLDCTPKGERAFNKASELWADLPKREQANICKQIPNVKGCY